MVTLYALLVFLVGASLTSSSSTNRVVCYYESSSVYRPGNGKFTIEDIDPNCSHLIYSFVGIDRSDGSIKILDEENDVTNGGMTQFNALKELTPFLKTSVAIGGWDEGSFNYSAVASDADKRKKLISDAVKLLQTYGFDGFDLDWEYPTQRGGLASDKENFATLLREFREEFDKHGYLLTAAVAPTGATVDEAYDVPNLSRYLDFIHVLAYNIHGPGDGVTGESAPLYPSHLDITAAQKLLNVEASVKGWIEKGADPAKLILGIEAYGRSFILGGGSYTGIGAPIVGAGRPGPYTKQRGTLSYMEICEMQQEGGWTEVWNEEQQVPYAYKDDLWVSYDNPRSIQLKIDFARSCGLGGVMVWSLAADDFRGICGTKYPLLSTIKGAIPIDARMSPTGSPTSGSSVNLTQMTCVFFVIMISINF